MSGVRTPKKASKGMTFTRHLQGESNSALTEVDGVSNIIIPVDCFLVAIQGSAQLEGQADNDDATFECSSSSNFQGNTNDVAETLMVLRTGFSLAGASGNSYQHTNGNVSGMKIPFSAGERIFFNLGHTTTVVGRASFVLHFQTR